MFDLEIKPEKTILVSVIRKGSDREIAHEHLEELQALAETAGAEIVETFTQELAKPLNSTMIGKGKIEELTEYIKENKIMLVIFDDDLSPLQMRNLEKAFEVKVLDRSGLILDIFAKRAQSNEAKTQVELAQMQYLMPRLTRMWTHLSKQFGGIGSKGPGETQIESDRRVVKIRIQMFKEKLAEISQQREIQRKSREKMPKFALVGYTNAGKSTLMRAITEADVYIEDKLFATLDTTVRQFTLPNGKKAVLSDTVGFIRKLPTHLVASFRSTLAEASEADVLIHIVDVSNPYFKDHIKVVEDTLNSLKIVDVPTILVLNKIDLVDESIGLSSIQEEYSNSIFVSASRSINIQLLLQTMEDVFNRNSSTIEILLPYTAMDQLKLIYANSEIVETEDLDEGKRFILRAKDNDYNMIKNKFSKYLIV